MPINDAFDVFLSHNSRNTPLVDELKRLLVAQGISVWLDRDESRPGLHWQVTLENGIRASKSVAVLIGSDGLGPWEKEEMHGALLLAVTDKRPVIPVLLPDAPENVPELPMFLTTRTWVDLRPAMTQEKIGHLIWGITGRKIAEGDKLRDSSIDALDNQMFPGTQSRFLDPHLLHLYEIRGTSFLDEYYRLLKHFHHPAPIHDTLDGLVEIIESLPQNRGALASVSGFAATGKSCLLTCIYLRQIERFRGKKTRFAPVFVNLRHYLSEDKGVEKTDTEATTSILLNEVRQLCDVARSLRGDGLMLIVDGCEEYYRHPRQKVIDGQLQTLVEELSYRSRVIKIVGVGQSDHAYPADRQSNVLGWAERDDLVQLRRLSIDDPAVDEVLAEYVQINAKDKKALSIQAMQQRIRGHRIDEIDLFVLSLIEESIRKKWAVESDGLEALYSSYCSEHIQLADGKHAKGEQAIPAVKRLAAEVFNFYVRRPFRESTGVPLQAEDRHEYDRVRLVGIPHLHATVKEYLIADHIIDLIVSSTQDDARRERFIYPYGINRFVRSIINRDESMQERVLAAIKHHYKDSMIRERIHLAYLLGRFKSSNVCEEAKSLLQTYLHDHSRENGEDAANLPAMDSIEFRQRLLLERTLSISAVYLGDRSAAKAYLTALLNNPLSDDLNRGFHLEYYEDAPRIPNPEVMIARDDLEIAPSKTFEVLAKKLEADVSTKTIRAMTSIELHTLCSLCLHRHVFGRLVALKRMRLLQIITEFRRLTSPDLPAELVSYLEMVESVLQREHASIGSVFSDLHALKKRRRAGWTTVRRLGDEEFERDCDAPESVSDHIWGCLLIAEAFLPEECAGEESYSKREILRMLLIHDLAETFTGDKPSFQKTSEDKREEDRLMRRISALSAFPSLSGMRPWRDSWSKLPHRDGINAKIACDIDTIENYWQLMQYLRTPKCIIQDAELWAADVLKDLSTEIGRQIFRSLRHPDSDLLRWYANETVPTMSSKP